mmetsp:Transcript_15390/g.26637  ORF Transcript_15390/g.26637 Transcript_15390/m.26637 type:complete len:227 (+) Transcript_15390:388-1068(+)
MAMKRSPPSSTRRITTVSSCMGFGVRASSSAAGSLFTQMHSVMVHWPPAGTMPSTGSVVSHAGSAGSSSSSPRWLGGGMKCHRPSTAPVLLRVTVTVRISHSCRGSPRSNTLGLNVHLGRCRAACWSTWRRDSWSTTSTFGRTRWRACSMKAAATGLWSLAVISLRLYDNWCSSLLVERHNTRSHQAGVRRFCCTWTGVPFRISTSAESVLTARLPLEAPAFSSPM